MSSNPVQAAYYADRMQQIDAPVLLNHQMARDTFLVRLAAPEIAASVVPGQFVMARIAHLDDPLIGRALAVYNIGSDPEGNPATIDLVYIRKGKLTSSLSRAAIGSTITIWGPLGNGFSSETCQHLIMVAGGIGQTPFVLLAQEALGQRSFPDRPAGWADRVTLIYGARTAELLAGVEDFQACGVDVRLCTDDGSRGSQMLAPELLAEMLRSEFAEAQSRSVVRVACCGPEVMMQRVAELSSQLAVRCEVSLETPMACGIGICFSCVAKIRQADGQWDYKRTCVEGPVFSAEKIDW